MVQFKGAAEGMRSQSFLLSQAIPTTRGQSAAGETPDCWLEGLATPGTCSAVLQVTVTYPAWPAPTPFCVYSHVQHNDLWSIRDCGYNSGP